MQDYATSLLFIINHTLHLVMKVSSKCAYQRQLIKENIFSAVFWAPRHRALREPQKSWKDFFETIKNFRSYNSAAPPRGNLPERP